MEFSGSSRRRTGGTLSRLRIKGASAFLLLSFAVPLTSEAQTFTTLADFGKSTAHGPVGIIQGSDGNFYGTTERGGSPGDGTVFQMTPSGALTVLYNFKGNDGSTPTAGLVEGADGNFYGTTSVGGTRNNGTVFKITPDGNLTTLYTFGTNAGDGASSYAPLIQASDGNFYGTTKGGGPNAAGTIFKITPNGDLTTLYAFHGLYGTDGGAPFSPLVQGTDGNFYGTLFDGGNSEDGAVFSYPFASSSTPTISAVVSASDFGALPAPGSKSMGPISHRSPVNGPAPISTATTRPPRLMASPSPWMASLRSSNTSPPAR